MASKSVSLCSDAVRMTTLDVGQMRRQLLRRGNAVELGHGDVHQDEIGTKPRRRQLDRRLPIRRLTDDFMSLRLKQTAKAIPKEGVIINDEDAHGR